MKAYKFKVDSPEQSERLQNVLFKLGYSWYCGGERTQELDKPYLFANNTSFIQYVRDSEEDFFYEDSNKLKDTEKFIRRHSEGQAECGIAKHSNEKKDKKSKWHSVADGLPPNTNQCYLVYCEGNGCQFTAQVDKHTVRWHDWTFGPSDVITYGHTITHWRKLPKSPKS
jgi:hypothetical protein